MIWNIYLGDLKKHIVLSEKKLPLAQKTIMGLCKDMNNDSFGFL